MNLLMLDSATWIPPPPRARRVSTRPSQGPLGTFIHHSLGRLSLETGCMPGPVLGNECRGRDGNGGEWGVNKMSSQDTVKYQMSSRVNKRYDSCYVLVLDSRARLPCPVLAGLHPELHWLGSLPPPTLVLSLSFICGGLKGREGQSSGQGDAFLLTPGCADGPCPCGWLACWGLGRGQQEQSLRPGLP